MPHARRASDAALAIAVLVALASLAGIAVPSLYAAETRSWRIQAIVQDWVDLAIGVPWLLATAAAARRGSARGLVLLTGGLIFIVYSFVIYAFAVHFNRAFLLYCAVLGLSELALVHAALALAAQGDTRWFSGREPRRAIAAFLTGSALLFAALWLARIVPALVRGETPAELAGSGLVTNPVHVLDLSLVLPSLALTGIALWRGHALGRLAAPPLLTFALLMNANVTLLTVALDAPPAVAVVLAALTLLSGGLLLTLLVAARPVMPLRAAHGHAG